MTEGSGAHKETETSRDRRSEGREVIVGLVSTGPRSLLSLRCHQRSLSSRYRPLPLDPNPETRTVVEESLESEHTPVDVQPQSRPESSPETGVRSRDGS